MRPCTLSVLLALLCSCLLLTPAALSAQARGMKVIVRDPRTQEEVAIYDNSWALLIGINRYQSVPALDYAVPDAQSVRELLIRKFSFPSTNITLVTDAQATRERIRQAFDDLSRRVGPNDRVIVFYAGHGETERLPAGGEMGYLVPVDGDRARLYLTCLSMEELNQLSRRMDAKHVLFLVDACYGGLAASAPRSLPPITQGYLRKITTPRARQILTAGRAGEQVFERSDWGHSAFTYELLQALDNELGDVDTDGLITARELATYMESHVARRSENRQRPMFAAFIPDEGEFVFQLPQHPAQALPPDTQRTPSTRPQPSPPPTPKPSPSGFSLEDLKREADRQAEETEAPARAEAQVKAAWDQKLRDMEQTYQQVQDFVKGRMASNLKRAAWERFTQAYAEDNPYSGRDEELRQHAQQEMGFWERHENVLRNDVGMEFVLIPAGEFLMGSNDGGGDEKPVHRVRISQPFYLGVYEVTQAQWEAVMGSNPSNFKGANRPVEKVSWEDAQEFIRRLNQREGGNSYRLPTEAEWEYACRAGTTGAYAGTLETMGWYNGNAGGQTHPVGEKQPNAWGLYDMHGNVWERVADWYQEDYYQRSPDKDPQGPSSGVGRGVRGGSWVNGANLTRSSRRTFGTPGDRVIDLGFRCARSLTP